MNAENAIQLAPNPAATALWAFSTRTSARQFHRIVESVERVRGYTSKTEYRLACGKVQRDATTSLQPPVDIDLCERCALSDFEGQAVYHCFDDEGLLLYVGRTCDLERRLTNHGDYRRQSNRWWPLVGEVRAFTYPDEQSAKAAEESAIRRLQPLFNIELNPAACRIPKVAIVPLESGEALACRYGLERTFPSVAAAIAHARVECIPYKMVSRSSPYRNLRTYRLPAASPAGSRSTSIDWLSEDPSMGIDASASQSPSQLFPNVDRRLFVPSVTHRDIHTRPQHGCDRCPPTPCVCGWRVGTCPQASEHRRGFAGAELTWIEAAR